jgi:hypothetical protein
MAAAAQPSTEILGMGGFGVVFSPAMNNINASGTRKSFPGHVTKLFFKEGSYKKAIADAEMLKQKLPALAIPYFPYEHVYKLKELNPTVIAKLAEKGPGHFKRGDPAYMLHMPNLGVSLKHFASDPALQARYKASVPFEKKVQEIYKLMTLVRAIGEAGVIHGDIREYNVLVNVDTGDMTIIDFDLLLTKGDFMARARRPFYSFPPETTYLCSAEWKEFADRYLGKTKIDWIGSLWRGFPQIDLFRAILDQVYKGWWPSDILGHRGPMIYNAANYYFELQERLRDKFEAGTAAAKDLEEVVDLTANTFDSYGLGYTLAIFFIHALVDKQDLPLIWYLRQNQLKFMTDPDPTRRLTIDKAMSFFKTFIGDEYKKRTGKEIEFPPDTPAARLAVLEAEVERVEEVGAAAAGGVGAAGAVAIVAPPSLPPNAPPSPIAQRASAAASAARVRTSSSSATRKRNNKPKSKSKTAANQ